MTSEAKQRSIPSAPPGRAMPPTFPDLYERHLVEPLFRPMAAALVDRAALREGDGLLDVACGTGIVARIARERLRSVRAVGVDRNPDMLAIARQLDAETEWREGDAAALPARSDERFACVLCHQGLQFFPDKPAAVAEMQRVLQPGGRVVVGVWRSLDENSLFADLGRTAERFVGPIRDARHAFASAEGLEALLDAAGFRDVQVERVTRTIRFADNAQALVELNATAVTGMSERGKAMTDADRANVVREMVKASAGDVAKYADGGVVTFEISANVASATQ